MLASVVLVLAAPFIVAAAILLISPLIIFLVALIFVLRLWKARLLGGAVRVTPDSFPSIHEALVTVRQQLDYRRPVDLYVLDKVDGKTQLVHLLGHRVILLEGGFAAGLQQEQYERLHFIIASHVGALKSRHERFALISVLLDYLKILKFVSPFLNPYYRATAYTGDQIGYLCVGRLEAALSVLARLMVGNEMSSQVSASGILGQAALVKRRTLARYSQLLSESPHLVNRYVNVIAFAARANQPDYERFLRGLDQESQECLQMLLNTSPHASRTPGSISA
ncbi:M48 family metalloprotease [Streptomyces coeruleorubidus]|uniref:M48 family metalloprotease n=1 Tax=Streptomyces coeruleorubidus TaxID=116188 RepID=UPI0036A21291